MSKKLKTETGTNETKKRVLLPLQSTGRVGKSTLTQAVAHWATYAGVDFAGLDGDAEHKTFSKKNKVQLVDLLESEDAFKRAMTGVVELPVPLVLVDMPAQATQGVLTLLEKQRTLDLFEQAGVSVTVPLFVADDETALQSLAVVTKTLGERVDYLLVRNLGRYKSSRFDGSSLHSKLEAQGALSYTIPSLTASTIEDSEKAAKQAGRHLDWQETLPLLPTASRFEFESWLNQLLVQCEDSSALLVPSQELIQQRVTRLSVPTGPAKINDLDPLA